MRSRTLIFPVVVAAVSTALCVPAAVAVPAHPVTSLPAHCAQDASTGRVTCTWTTSGRATTFVVPAGVSSVSVVAVGGAGGGVVAGEGQKLAVGGKGGVARATLDAGPNGFGRWSRTLVIEVAQPGGSAYAGGGDSPPQGGTGGGPGGGSPDYTTDFSSGGGGGYSAVSVGGVPPRSDARLVVAGGGGGGVAIRHADGSTTSLPGGNGGGGDADLAKGGGHGGTASHGGAGGSGPAHTHGWPGVLASGGNSEVPDSRATGVHHGGGGGGGGLFGGGSGRFSSTAADGTSTAIGAGGGGSSSGNSHEVSSADPFVRISFLPGPAAITLSPARSTVKVGVTQAYRVSVHDAYGRTLSDGTAGAGFTADTGATCAKNVCRASTAGTYTVDASYALTDGTYAYATATLTAYVS